MHAYRKAIKDPRIRSPPPSRAGAQASPFLSHLRSIPSHLPTEAGAP